MSARARFAWAFTALASLHCGRSSLRSPEWVDAAVSEDTAPVAREDVVGDALAQNECGGSAVLEGAPGAPCAACSRWSCASLEEVECVPFAQVNSCGTCGATPEEECNGRDDDCDGRVDEGCPLRLTTLRATVAHARISGERVAFDLRSRVSNASDSAVTTVEPMASVELLSPHSDPPGRSNDPSQDSETSLFEDRVAWITRRVDPLWNGGAVVSIDLATRRLETVSPRRSKHPSVGSGGRVVFESVGTRDDEWDVWLFDPARGAVALTGADGDEHTPELSGDRVVFTRGTGASPYFNQQIIVRDLRTGQERNVSTGLEGFHTEPAIDGDRVVWRQQSGTTAPSRTGLIWSFDLRSGERVRLDDDGAGYEPRISGSLVCWNTLSGFAGGVRLFDLETGHRATIVRDGHHCDVSGRRVIWLDGSSVTDVYYRELEADEP